MAGSKPVQTYRVLSAMLSYPTAELQEAVPEMRAVLDAEGLLTGKVRSSLDKFLSEIETKELYDLEERFVLLFDRTRTLALHLFEHVHGESRDRGQAMVDLAELYDRHGLMIDSKELPDYIPLFLEFLSTQPADEARELLEQPLHILAALKERLRKRQSPYASIFWAMETLSGQKPQENEVEALLKEAEDDPNDFEAIDKIWEEEQVTFGPGEPGCSKVSGMLERMNTDVPPPSTPRTD